MPLERTQSIRQVANQLANLCSPLVGGVLIGLIGASNLLWVNAGTFLVSALAIGAGVPGRLIPKPAKPEGRGVTAYGRQLQEGLQFIVSDRLVLMTVLVSTLANFIPRLPAQRSRSAIDPTGKKGPEAFGTSGPSWCAQHGR